MAVITSHGVVADRSDGLVSPGARTWERAYGRRGLLRGIAWRWLGIGITIAGVGLLPWMIYLALSLPATTRAWHWPAAWTGLDAIEAAGLVATGLLLLRRDLRYCLMALPTAGVLLADAWFDVTTSPPGAGELVSLVMAIAAELPTAALCLAIGVAGLRQLSAGQRPPGFSPLAASPAPLRGVPDGHPPGLHAGGSGWSPCRVACGGFRVALPGRSSQNSPHPGR
jgi:hypothetical protein